MVVSHLQLLQESHSRVGQTNPGLSVVADMQSVQYKSLNSVCRAWQSGSQRLLTRFRSLIRQVCESTRKMRGRCSEVTRRLLASRADMSLNFGSSMGCAHVFELTVKGQRQTVISVLTQS